MKITSVADLIESHEGRRYTVYRDSLGKTSIGVGRCLDTKPLKDFEVDFLRTNDIRDADNACVAIFGAEKFASFNAPRQAALTDMAFQLGEAGLRAFAEMRGAIERGDWDEAARCARDSKWAKQTPARAAMNADILRSGEWPA